jgi:hypothetical protein
VSYSYAVVLAGLLTLTGGGSYAAGRWAREPERAVRQALALVLVVVVGTAVITPDVFRLFLGAGLDVRIMIAMLLVAPLGFVLGMPFPLGLRLAMKRSSAPGSWTWDVNRFFANHRF